MNKTEQETPFSEESILLRPYIVAYIIFWSFQPSPTTVKRMTLISLPPCSSYIINRSHISKIKDERKFLRQVLQLVINISLQKKKISIVTRVSYITKRRNKKDSRRISKHWREKKTIMISRLLKCLSMGVRQVVLEVDVSLVFHFVYNEMAIIRVLNHQLEGGPIRSSLGIPCKHL